MNVLIACEYSGVVRDAFIKLGHNAISCDILPTDKLGPHFQGKIEDMNTSGFDLIIAHPPCIHLAVSGAKWFQEKIKDGRQQEAIDFFMYCINLPCDKIAVENPVSIMSTRYRKPDQYIQPWQFGHGETKKTGLWLKGLPLLKSTNIVEGREARVHKLPPSEDRWKLRSTTYQGIADAMASQWTEIAEELL